MRLRDDAVTLARPWLHSPGRRARHELYCLRLALIPHDDNNDARKASMLTLLAVWAVLTLGLVQPGGSVPGWLYTALTALLFAIIGRQWGVEVRGLPFDINSDDED